MALVGRLNEKKNRVSQRAIMIQQIDRQTDK